MAFDNAVGPVPWAEPEWRHCCVCERMAYSEDTDACDDHVIEHPDGGDLTCYHCKECD